VRKVWPSRGRKMAHRDFTSWVVVSAAVLALRYMAAVQHRSDVQAFHRAGRERGGRPIVVEERQQLGGVVRRGDAPGPGVEVQPSPASCASLLHGQQPGGSWTRPPVPAAKDGFGLLHRRPPLPPFLLPPPSSLLRWRRNWGKNPHGRRSTGRCGWGFDL
jgi:hypothetical protein